MPNFINLPPFTEDGDTHVVVETPRGSRAKYAYDPKLDAFTLSKSLLTGIYDYVHYQPKTHEGLGVARGEGKVQFGGTRGRILR